MYGYNLRYVVVSSVQTRVVVKYSNSKCFLLSEMYWTDWGLDTIEKAKKDGTERQVLIDTGLVSPRALVLDKARSKMFWADSRNDVIEVANTDGSGRQTFLSDIDWAPGLAIYGTCRVNTKDISQLCVLNITTYLSLDSM